MAIPYFKIYGKDFLAVTYDLTDAQVGKVVKLLCRQSIGLPVSAPENLQKIYEILKKDLDDTVKKYDDKCKQNQTASHARWMHHASQMHPRCIHNTEYRIQNTKEDTPHNPPKGRASPDLGFVAEPMREAFTEWLEYKRGRKETYKTAKSLEACYRNLAELSDNDPDKARRIIEQSMANNWAGLFALKDNPATRRTGGTYSTYDGTYSKDIPL